MYGYLSNTKQSLALKLMAIYTLKSNQLECGPMPNLMVALPNIGGALCSTPQSLADARFFAEYCIVGIPHNAAMMQ